MTACACWASFQKSGWLASASRRWASAALAGTSKTHHDPGDVLGQVCESISQLVHRALRWVAWAVRRVVARSALVHRHYNIVEAAVAWCGRCMVRDVERIEAAHAAVLE